MTDVHAFGGKGATNQQAAMAIERIGFGAHRGDPMMLSAGNEPLQARAERRDLGHLFVVGHAAGEQIRPFRAPAQILAEKHIRDAAFCKRGCQAVLVEVWQEARDRRGAHIGDRGDARSL